MTIRRRAAATGGIALALLALACAVALLGHVDEPRVNVGFGLTSLALGAALGAVGCLLLGIRRGNVLGPLLTLAGGGLVAEFAFREYAYRGLPHAAAAAWAGLALDPLFFPVSIALILFFFPGVRVAARWTWVLVGGLALMATQVAVHALRSGPLEDETYGYWVPWDGVLPTDAPVDAILDALIVAGILLLVAAVVTLLLRYVRADPDVRQRLKPLALAATIAVVCLALQLVPGLRDVATLAFVLALSAGFPIALAVGALRYRVWDFDPILVRTLVYGTLAAFVTVIYVAVVVGLSALSGARLRDNVAVSVAATALVAVSFGPVKQRIEHAARRLVYGVRASPYEALAALPHRLAEVPAVDEVLTSTAEALAQGLGVAAARVRAFVSGTTREAWSPSPPRSSPPQSSSAVGGSSSAVGGSASSSAVGGLTVVEVRHLGAVVGDVAVATWPDRQLSAADRSLLVDLAAQAGPALRGVALAAELEARLVDLRASRQRLVSAQVQERRRLERDIHDGAQQQLVALAVAIQAAERLLDDVIGGNAPLEDRRQDVERARTALYEAARQVQACIDDLRELARGVYPPVLAARGLVAALRARARTGGISVTHTPALDGLRFAADVELAVYFACLEAMQNVAKHAPGAAARLVLDYDGGVLSFVLSDDGPGFDGREVDGSGVGSSGGAAAGRGSGLVAMADRVGAAGGSVTVHAAPGAGTTVRASVTATPVT